MFRIDFESDCQPSSLIVDCISLDSSHTPSSGDPFGHNGRSKWSTGETGEANLWSEHRQIALDWATRDNPPEDRELIEQLSPLEDIPSIREGTLEKRVVSHHIYWSKRHVKLTPARIYLVQEKSGQVREDIDLLLITQVQRISSFNPQGIPVTPQNNDNKNDALHMVEWENVIEILTEALGRTYYLRAESKESSDAWFEDIKAAIAQAHLDFQLGLNLSLEQRFRRQVRAAYDSHHTQIFIAALLLFNFLVNLLGVSELELMCE